jgi:hypothetical protein
VLTSRIGVKAPPQRFEGESNLMGRSALRALEHEVLQQMADTTRFRRFMCGALGDPHTDSDGSYVGPSFGYDPYAVIEHRLTHFGPRKSSALSLLGLTLVVPRVAVRTAARGILR